MKTRAWTVVGIASFLTGLGACKAKEAGGIEPQAMADALHGVLAADRAIYTKMVVNRLQNEDKVIKASEHWKDDKALPLPAQMFRMGADEFHKANPDLSYSLLSQWPINKQNAPKTDAEKTGLKSVVDNADKTFYTSETLGGREYFTAVYADKAVAPACVECHNSHAESAKRDFQLNDVMGAVVIRIAR